MKGKALKLVCVGRMKIPFLREAAAHYARRLGQWRQLELCEVKDGDASLGPEQRSEIESRRIIASLDGRDILILLDERGKRPDSRGLASLLRNFDEQASGRPCLVVGGAFGHHDSLRQKASHVISLSSMTLPHELARVVLLEQLYRAETILRNLPYHH